MSCPTDNLTDTLVGEIESPPRAGVTGSLPVSVVMTQRCAAELRAYLREAKLDHYRIFHCQSHELYDIERTLEKLGEVAAWETLPPLVDAGEPINCVTFDSPPKLWESGVLRLAKHEAVLARWYWITTDGYATVRLMWLCASASAQKFGDLQAEVTAMARQQRIDSWHVVRGYAHSDDPAIPRKAPADLMLTDALKNRVEREITGFFADEVAELYRSLQVPYRRGVLLHGPPGNGKTSLIRHIGMSLPKVAAMLLRTTSEFDTDAFEEVMRRWTTQAPAILVIEDLNWLLEKINVSTFLNLLDGIDNNVGAGGLLLIATTNHPDKLDPAVNNRPGRFDVVIEMPVPDERMRRTFFASKLAGLLDEGVVANLTAKTDRLSFAHLQEILRLSGLAAIHAGRTKRLAEDLYSAADTVTESHEAAVRGFPMKTEIPFGLLPLREQRRNAMAT